MIKDKIIKAFKEVKKYHKNVSACALLSDGRWQFFNENFVAPTFSKELDTTPLEEMSDEIGKACLIEIFEGDSIYLNGTKLNS